MAESFELSDPDPVPGAERVRNTFVVRIWSSDGSNLLRGRVQHVRSRKRAYFATRERLRQFIQAHMQDLAGG